MKKKSRIISIMLVLFMMISLCTSVFAKTTGVSSPSSLTGKAVQGTTSITNIGNQLVTILTTVGVVVSVIVLIVLGIKYMMGSAE